MIDRRPFHNIGLYNVKYLNGEQGYPESDKGLADISTLAADNGRFRAPTLRNVAVSAPYMHDGSMSSLSDVLDFYAAGGRNLTEGINRGDGRTNHLKSPFIQGFALSEEDKADLIAFLHTLTDQQFLTDQRHAMSTSDH